ncbi:Zn-ribbon domain-containing OB-fold protein [Rhodococcoides fascians]|uniref:Zn-ribbon domain-containing OB-fold protein n=1 Tax=Rhodococcoides fascians TaxID=1828 RepID=UPI0006907D61|nr:OB-fold domain-containing protein [Rhodococcus fascians]
MVHLPFSGTDAAAAAAMINADLPDFAQFWQGCSEGVLRLQWCPTCDRHQWPPRPVCRRCGGSPEWVDARGEGRLYSWTVVHLSPLSAFAGSVPYVVAIAELDYAEGVRVVARLADDSSTPLQIGMDLMLAFELLDGGLALPVWRHVDGQRSPASG